MTEMVTTNLFEMSAEHVSFDDENGRLKLRNADETVPKYVRLEREKII